MEELCEEVKEEEHSLAWETMVELKHSAKRWFIAFCIMVGLEVGTIAGFMWYISLPIEESVQNIDQQTDSGGNNNGVIGGDLNGDKTEDNSNQEEESSPQ